MGNGVGFEKKLAKKIETYQGKYVKYKFTSVTANNEPLFECI